MTGLPTTNECPKSLLSRTKEGVKARWLVDKIRDNDLVREYTKAQMFGNDSAKWPEWWWDAILAVGIEKKKIEIAEMSYRIMQEQNKRWQG